MWYKLYLLEAVYKRRLHKIAKNWPLPPLSEKCPHCLNSPCPCGHSINVKKSEDFCIKKWGRPLLMNPLPPCPLWTNLLYPDVFYGQLLSKCLLLFIFLWKLILTNHWFQQQKYSKTTVYIIYFNKAFLVESCQYCKVVLSWDYTDVTTNAVSVDSEGNFSLKCSRGDRWSDRHVFKVECDFWCFKCRKQSKNK